MKFEVNSNGNIIDGVNHCYAFGKINDETIFSDNDFPCPTFSNIYGHISYDDAALYFGGDSTESTGAVRNLQFEWLEEVTLIEELTPKFRSKASACDLYSLTCGMLIGKITLNQDCFELRFPSTSAEDFFLQVTSNPSWGLYIELTIF